jgi:hypothetical protein
MYQTHAIQSIQIVLLLINEQGGKKGSRIREGFVLSEKNDIMKGKKTWSLLNENNNKL